MIHIQSEAYRDDAKIADVTLYSPLTARKLIGVANRLLEPETVALIQCGPFEMNPTTRMLTVDGQDIQLNPKLADLIELFFRHPNEILSRETIMKRVWDTSYMGDTRTLDVHIRHARNVLESGQKRPQFLKTVRGVGYCLAIQPEDD
jgi:DNA-binding response OmpR family regulator